MTKPQHTFPADDAILSGREHLEQYLGPLAGQLAAQIKTETQVVKIGRRGVLKHESPGDQGRARHPFLLLLRDKNQERLEEADVVLDCTGTYGQHRWLGSGGVPAVGEVQFEPQIVYGLDDVLGEKQKDYANKSILVVGAGYSAATTVSNLATLAEQHNTTWITWIARAAHSQPLRRLANDPLRERDRLAARANNLATRTDANVEFHGQTVVEAIQSLGQAGGFRVTCRCTGKVRTWEVERVIGNVGYTPDTELYRELQVDTCFATLGARQQAKAMLAQKGQDGLRPSWPGPAALGQPEPNFYVLGAKSFGRNSQFLLRVGFEQVRDIFALITGNARLDLFGK
jgi:thioredoxin reductase